MINYKETEHIYIYIYVHTHKIIKQVKYECSYVYIVMTSRQKLANGMKGIFNKVLP